MTSRREWVMTSAITIDRRPRAWPFSLIVETQDTESKQRRTRGLRPFVKGDGRINRRGRPRNFDALRELCQRICNEEVTLDGEVMTRLEVLLRDWIRSKDPQKQIALVQYAYGKPVDKIETNLTPGTVLVLHYAHERPGLQQPDEPNIAVKSGEGARRPLLPDAD
jgi:hypothetical protein